MIDVAHFRKTLERDVRIVTRDELPAKLRKRDTWQLANRTVAGHPRGKRLCAKVYSAFVG